MITRLWVLIVVLLKIQAFMDVTIVSNHNYLPITMAQHNLTSGSRQTAPL